MFSGRRHRSKSGRLHGSVVLLPDLSYCLISPFHSAYSGEPLYEPVLCEGVYIERSVSEQQKHGGVLFSPARKDTNILPAPRSLLTMIKRNAWKVSRLVVYDKTLDVPVLMVRKLVLGDIASGVKMANEDLPIYAPLSLKNQAITPALTLDEAGNLAVFTSRGDLCAPPDIDVVLLRPCHGGETPVDVNMVISSDRQFVLDHSHMPCQVAVRLEPVIKHKKAIDEWDIDAFAGSTTDKVDTRSIEEGVGTFLAQMRLCTSRLIDPQS